MSEAKATNSSSPQMLHLPPGFRFHPTDEELVVDYLAGKAESKPFPIPVIAEVDLYKFNPWELPEKAYFGEKELYFFTPRDRKYPKGARPNRAAGAGYWKATGIDKPILTTRGRKRVGVKKALVFYDGKAPKGMKTSWIMHEYRLVETSSSNKPNNQTSLNTPLILEVLLSRSSSDSILNDDSWLPEQPKSHKEEIISSSPDSSPTASASGSKWCTGTMTLKALLFFSYIRQSTQSSSLHAQHPVETIGFEEKKERKKLDEPLQDVKSLATEVGNKLELSNYWSLYSHGNYLTREASLQQMESPRKRTKLDLEEDAVSSTCRFPEPPFKQRQQQLRML